MAEAIVDAVKAGAMSTATTKTMLSASMMPAASGIML